MKLSFYLPQETGRPKSSFSNLKGKRPEEEDLHLRVREEITMVKFSKVDGLRKGRLGGAFGQKESCLKFSPS